MTGISVGAAATVLVALGGGTATVGVIALTNRQNIRRLRDELFGHPDSDRDSSLEDEVDSVVDKLDRIEQKIDEEKEQRRSHHRDIRRAVEENREVTVRSAERIAGAVDDHTEAELDIDEKLPDEGPFDDD